MDLHGLAHVILLYIKLGIIPGYFRASAFLLRHTAPNLMAFVNTNLYVILSNRDPILVISVWLWLKEPGVWSPRMARPTTVVSTDATRGDLVGRIYPLTPCDAQALCTSFGRGTRWVRA
ncbi:hypothetical protein K461DRAFT_81560 [Myriangium duriaei CBS 260.36]|uniref:Uncharacterized protein n=1 Tax=Myriangium duriaei CBS 260.36 TaxID=1168546 RepID=A0A9P4J654_9PEZI|nr:hypothetical protein K461DRAFT_81560 [Myriangium duriaei CBS 260.36]